MYGGYWGKVLRVNLTNKTYKVEPLPEKVAKDFIGGAGVGIKYLYDEVPAGTDPLSPENKLIFATGPLTGTRTPSTSRLALATKSPLTGIVCLSLSGGHFPVEFKNTGHDVLIIEGKSEEPVYLYIKDNQVEFRPADKLWGTTTHDCEHLIKTWLNDHNIRVASIGPAAENMSKIASIMNDRNRAFGRRGTGTVMASKNLKAIAVKGTKKVSIASEDAFKEVHAKMLKAFKEAPGLYPALGQHGTSSVIEILWGLGACPAKNFSATGEWNPVPGLGIATLSAKKIGKEPCYGCPVACTQVRLVKEGRYKGTVSPPEYETVFALGAQCGIDNIDAIIYGDRLCNELGLDSISTGVTIGFAMELYERGIITKEDTGGLELKFGNEGAMLELIRQMAYREGFGAVLADGSKAAAEKIGRGAEKYAMIIKGIEMPGYDPRALKTHGFSFATTYTGADHNKGYSSQDVFGIPIPEPVDRLDPKGKGRITKWNQDAKAACCDAAVMCNFVFDAHYMPGPLEHMAELFNAVCGYNFTAEDVIKVGERINNLARAFNVREGISRKDDTFPERILTEPLKEGGSKGSYIPREQLDMMLDEYYEVRGWNKNGIPTEEKLKELGLEYVIEDLKKMGCL